MKKLIYLLWLSSVFACQSAQKAESLLSQADTVIIQDNRAMDKQQEQFVAMLELWVEETGKSSHGLQTLKRCRLLQQKLVTAIAQIQQTEDEIQLQKIHREYISWVEKKFADLGIEERMFSDWKNHLSLGNHLSSKTLRQHHLYQINKDIFYRLNDDLGHTIYDQFSPPIIFETSPTNPEEGDNVDLELFVYKLSRHYYLEKASTNQGKLQRKPDGFSLTVPTKALGKQTLQLRLQVYDRRIDTDTTLVLKHTFEVIE